MAEGANDKEDSNIRTSEPDEQNLLSDASNFKIQEKIKSEKTHEDFNKNTVENNVQQNYDNKAIKPQTKQDNNIVKKHESTVNNLNNTKINSELESNNVVNEEVNQIKLELVSENLKNASKEFSAEFKWTEKTEDKKNSRRNSHYLQNIQMTNSTLGLTLNGSEKKDTNLLTDSKTVVRFSPLWKQVIICLNVYYYSRL